MRPKGLEGGWIKKLNTNLVGGECHDEEPREGPNALKEGYGRMSRCQVNLSCDKALVGAKCRMSRISWKEGANFRWECASATREELTAISTSSSVSRCARMGYGV